MIDLLSTYEFLVADRQRELRADSARWTFARIVRRARRERRTAAAMGAATTLRAVPAQPNYSGYYDRAA